MKYLTLIHKSKYGYDVRVPALPGCHSQGATKAEAMKNVRDAIRTYLEMDEDMSKDSEVREVSVSLT